jgi:hypothetical protein
MAKITFSLEELVEVLIANDLIFENIRRIKVKDGVVHFVIKTQLFMLPLIPASLKFLSFENNKATFELTLVSSHLGKVISRHNHILESELPSCMEFEYPNVMIDMEKLLQEKNIRGLQIKDVLFKDSDFTVTIDND